MGSSGSKVKTVSWFHENQADIDGLHEDVVVMRNMIVNYSNSLRATVKAQQDLANGFAGCVGFRRGVRCVWLFSLCCAACCCPL